ncbi:hypothetical protein ACFXKD_27420 [Nocardiopsis aegyptia]|uniref:hypothetical protein n=1 Tax=Nocardiopsis aegyptia TaxID=220378 RepID=UPI0036732005
MTTFTVEPTADMLAEAFEDGTPCHWTVYDADGRDIGAVAAGMTARQWLPTVGVGNHGPLFPTMEDAARWAADNHTGKENPVSTPTDDNATATTQFAQRLTALLAVRGTDDEILRALRDADSVFDDLHWFMRTGGQPPRGWFPGKGPEGQRYTTAWFDALSETLRDPNARPTLRQTINAAEVAWNALDAALHDGAPLPEPWRRADTSD